MLTCARHFRCLGATLIINTLSHVGGAQNTDFCYRILLVLRPEIYTGIATTGQKWIDLCSKQDKKEVFACCERWDDWVSCLLPVKNFKYCRLNLETQTKMSTHMETIQNSGDCFSAGVRSAYTAKLTKLTTWDKKSMAILLLTLIYIPLLPPLLSPLPTTILFINLIG